MGSRRAAGVGGECAACPRTSGSPEKEHERRGLVGDAPRRCGTAASSCTSFNEVQPPGRGIRAELRRVVLHAVQGCHELGPRLGAWSSGMPGSRRQGTSITHNPRAALSKSACRKPNFGLQKSQLWLAEIPTSACRKPNVGIIENPTLGFRKHEVGGDVGSIETRRW